MTENFKLSEMTYSETAIKWKVDNTPPDALLPNIFQTLKGLERIRVLTGNRAIRILSGYRNTQVNKLVGGDPVSQHLTGEAADIILPRLR